MDSTVLTQQKIRNSETVYIYICHVVTETEERNGKGKMKRKNHSLQLRHAKTDIQNKETFEFEL